MKNSVIIWNFAGRDLSYFSWLPLALFSGALSLPPCFISTFTDAQEFQYTCVTDGILECASSFEFIEDKERKRILNQLGRK